jgi:hypothetical protein
MLMGRRNPMPLRDHFRSPLDDVTAWEGFHGGWPMVIVQRLGQILPARYVAAPRVHSGSYVEIDYEVRVFDAKRGRRLVAAIEIVSPANKDRPENRRLFVAKCAALLQQRVAVSIIDLVTIRNFNLYADLLELLGQGDPSLAPEPPPLYAVSCRSRPANNKGLLESWLYPLNIGQPLPTLPLWLTASLSVPLELEASYEQTCKDLRIP